MRKTIGLIMAGGIGKRFHSEIPKVFHPLLGVPLVEYPVRALKEAGITRFYLVVQKGYEALAEGITGNRVIQEGVTGTARAVLSAQKYLKDFHGYLLVLSGDVPLITAKSLREFLENHRKNKAFASLMGARMDSAAGYGRILVKGFQVEVREAEELSEEERERHLVNVGIYLFPCPEIFGYLEKIPPAASGEYYLPRVFSLFAWEKKKVALYELVDPAEGKGINTREELTEVTISLRHRILHHWQEKGVTFEDLNTILVGPDVVFQPDCFIHSGSYLIGRTLVEKHCVVGPFAYLCDVHLGEGSRVWFSHLDGCRIGKKCEIGPFARLRPGTVLEDEVRIGNFVEVKNSHISSRVKAAHLSYLGDVTIGASANIGAGTITCNYDGIKKHRTRIGEGAFIGSHTTLVAPVEVGKEAYTAAGSVITASVPAYALAIARSRQVLKKNWVRLRKKRELSD
ncbi:MAG: bifunctional UDP-N-acetylglucosamine diphosphorylase/glucosamine-1-phosphate N-acetyltransferase GlmU [bacterium JZ-2024 1]